MHIYINTLISILITLVFGVMLLIVSSSRHKQHFRQAFQIFLLAMIFFGAVNFVVWAQIATAPIWFRLLLTGLIASILGIFHLLQVILSNHQKWTNAVYWIGLIVMAINAATTVFIKSANLGSQGIRFSFSIPVYFIALFAIGLLIFSITDLLRSHRQADDPTQRNRLRYFLSGSGLMIASLLLHIRPVGRFPADLMVSGMAAAMISFAILKSHLTDIDVIVRRSILYTVPATIIGAIYFLFITLALKLFDADSGLQLFLVSMLVAILTAIIAQPQHEKIRSWIDRLFFRDKYNSSLMLQRISQTATSLLEVNMLANMILDEISATMNIERSAFLLKDKQTKEFCLIVHRNLEKNTNIRLKADHPVILRLIQSEEALTKRDISILPQFKSLWEEEKAALEKINAEVYIPLRSQGELIGILAVGNRRSNEPYSQDDQSSLTTLGNQVAVAIENARLYTTEQNRRKELDSLYTLSRQLIATDTMNTVLKSVVEHTLDSVHVTFTRILLRSENGIYICRAAHPVFELNYDLRLGKVESSAIYRYYEMAIESREPLVLERNHITFTPDERKSLFLEHIHSLCLCPLRIGDEPIGILVLGERRHVSRESFDADKLRLASAIADQASGAIRRVRLYEQLEESFVQTILALANAIDAKDNYTSDHGERLARLATLTASRLNCSPQEIQAINWGMRLHDIGKIGVSDEILQKPGSLTDDEWQQMRKHPEIGANIIAPVKNLSSVTEIILHHHERFDGFGYPHKLSGEKIPLGARIITVVDSYGAMTDKRVYRNARSHREAMAEIVRCTGSQFDPDITAAFTAVIEEQRKSHSVPAQNYVGKERVVTGD